MPIVPLHLQQLTDGDLTAIQQQIVYAPPRGEIVVGGVAGSGKTIAAIYRAVHLCQCTPRRNNEMTVLFLCYNRPLACAVQQVVGSFPSSIYSRIVVRTVHQWCAAYVRNRLPGYTVISDEDRIALVREAISETRYSLGAHEVFDFGPQMFLDEIRLIKGCQLIDRESYMDRQNAHVGALPAEYYQLIFAVAETYERLLRARSEIDFDDFAPIALSAITGTRHVARNDHVILDEAQDLSDVQIELARSIARQSLMVIADQAQTIYRVARLPDTLPSEETYDFVLPESFRSTRQIFAHARHLLPEPTRYQEPNRDGPPPEVHYFRWIEDEANFIVEKVAHLLQNGVSPTEIAILARQRAVLPPILEALQGRDLPIAPERESSEQIAGIIATSIHLSKGREFRFVFVPGIVEGVFPRLMPEMDRAAIGQELALARRQLYVAMTRSSEYLWLTGSEGRHSRFFEELQLPVELPIEEELWAS